MKYIKKYIFRLLFVYALLLVCLGVTGQAQNYTDTELLIKNATEYWKKGTLIQYDDPEKYRQSLYFSPEEVSKKHIYYSNCGAFVSALYMETFGIELPWRTENLEPYMRKNRNTPYVVDALETRAYTKRIKNGTLISRIARKIELGDLILCRFNKRSPKGHVMMVYELIKDEDGKVIDAWLIHSTGDKTHEENFRSAYDRKQREGTIRISKMSRLLGGFYSKLVNGESYVYYYGILRPLANNGKWLTTEGKQVSYHTTDNTQKRFGVIEGKVQKRNDKKLISKCYIRAASRVKYTGRNVVPKIVVRTEKGGTKLKRGVDYLVVYLKDDNVKRGRAFVNVMGIGNYRGMKKINFTIY